MQGGDRDGRAQAARSGAVANAAASQSGVEQQRGSENAASPQDNSIVRFRGLSLSHLVKLRDTLYAGSGFRHVELCTLQQSACRVAEGQTVRVLTRSSLDDTCECAHAFLGTVFVPAAALAPKRHRDWTVEDVCEHVVLPQVRADKAFYLDLVDPSEVGERFQGTFVSQARKSKFGDLVDALVLHYRQREGGEGALYVWIDLFSANQPLLSKQADQTDSSVERQRETLLKRGLHQAIQLFDERLLFFNSWADPYPLQRAWCVWEIFGAVKSGKPIQLLFKPGEREAFASSGLLARDAKDIVDRMANFSLEDAKCQSAKDKLEIDAAVEAEIGYHALNVRISGLVSEWLVRFAHETVALARGRGRSQHTLKTVLDAAGAFFQTLGMPDAALGLLFESVALARALGMETTAPLHLSFSLSELGRVLHDLDRGPEAVEHMHEALNLVRRVEGDCSPNLASAMHEMARVLRAQGDHAGALEHLSRVRAIDLELAHGTAAGAATMIEVGRALLDAGDAEAAWASFEVALNARAADGADGEGCQGVSNTMAALAGLAEVARYCGEHAEALIHFRQVLRLEERSRGGRAHLDVAHTLASIGAELLATGDPAAAAETLVEALEVLHALPRQAACTNLALAVLADLAAALFADGRGDSARCRLEELSAAASFGCKFDSALIRLDELGVELRNQSRFDQAVAVFEAAARALERVRGAVDADVASLRYEAALTFSAAGDVRAAIAMWSELLVVEEGLRGGQAKQAVATTMLEIGKAFAKLGEHHQAAIHFADSLGAQEAVIAGAEEAADVEAETLHRLAVTRLNLGVALRELGRLGQAREHLEAATEAFGGGADSPTARQDYAIALVELGRLFQKQRDWAQAERALRRAAAAGGDHACGFRLELAEALAGIGECARANDLLLDARPSVDIAVALVAPVQRVAAQCFLGWGDSAAAVSLAQAAAQLAAGSEAEFGALQFLGCVLRDANSVPASVAAFDAAAALVAEPGSPRSALADLQAGETLRLLGHLVEASRLLESAEARARSSGSEQDLARVLLALGATRRMQQRNVEAADLLAEALELDHGNEPRFVAAADLELELAAAALSANRVAGCAPRRAR